MEIALMVIGFILTTIGVYFWASRIFRRSEWKEIHGHYVKEGPIIVIDKIVGTRYDHGEPTLRNRPAHEDDSKPWRTKRAGDDDRETPYFDWQWKERTPDELGDAYYEEIDEDVFFQGERIKQHCRLQRWWEFKRLSKNSPNGEGPRQIYERR